MIPLPIGAIDLELPISVILRSLSTVIEGKPPSLVVVPGVLRRDPLLLKFELLIFESL
jgi:hypothetical protein